VPDDPALQEVDPNLAALLAVAGHGLLSPLAGVTGLLDTLTQRWGSLSEDQRLDIVLTAQAQARYMVGLVKNLVRGIPPEARQLLDEMAATSGIRGNPQLE
jgi:K+-sensing histidine kinase KdpD